MRQLASFVFGTCIGVIAAQNYQLPNISQVGKDLYNYANKLFDGKMLTKEEPKK